MDIVIGDIPSDHQTDGWDIQAGCVVGVTVPNFNGNQAVPFELDYRSLEFFGNHKPIWKQARKLRIPVGVEELRRGLLAHMFHYSGHGNCTGPGKTFQERSEAKEMVTVTMGEIDRRQFLPMCFNPFSHHVCLLDVSKVSTRTASCLPKM